MNSSEKLEKIEYDDFIKVEMRVGKIISVKENDKAYKPAYLLQIDFGEDFGTKQSSAQIVNYDQKELLNKNVVCITNFPTKVVAGYRSEVLVLGVENTDGDIILLTVDDKDKNVPLGNRIY